jgi:hypothetical protein
MSPALIIFPASQFRGLSALGLLSKAVIALHMASRFQAGHQSDFNTSRQISPESKCTFGWKTLVLKETLGAVNGYVSGILNWMRNRPDAYGESEGPIIVASQISMLSPMYCRLNSSLLALSSRSNLVRHDIVLLLYVMHVERDRCDKVIIILDQKHICSRHLGV